MGSLTRCTMCRREPRHGLASGLAGHRLAELISRSDYESPSRDHNSRLRDLYIVSAGHLLPVILLAPLALGTSNQGRNTALANEPTTTATLGVERLREERQIVVDGRKEVWRLMWRTAPKPFCPPDDEDWFTCPCAGFAFGEEGAVDLVRMREGKEIERLPLAPFFDQDAFPGPTGGAVLRRWEPREDDSDEHASKALPEKVYRRPVSAIMHFGDYDHDGWTTEFVLQVGTVACGHRLAVVVGVSRRNPHLHAFGTAVRPDKPLALDPRYWDALLRATGPTNVIEWACWDHGSDTETELELRTGPEGISGVRREFDCKEPVGRGALISEAKF
jgi:hypothetical protein